MRRVVGRSNAPAPSLTARRGDAFRYENSNGLAEIAVNQGRADRVLGLAVGSTVSIVNTRERR